MSNERLIMAIGRIERALSRIEGYEPQETVASDNGELVQRHEKLKSEMREAITAIDSIIEKQEG